MENFADMGRRQLDRNGFRLLKVEGRSMRPLIWSMRHCVAVVPLEGEPEVGDMLVFARTMANGKSRAIVHRLVEIRGEGDDRFYINRGDNCLAVEHVRRDEIIGRVAEVHRVGGWRPWYAIPRRQFAVTDRAYLRYVRLWGATWPLRRICFFLRGKAYGLWGRIGVLLAWPKRTKRP